MASMSKQLQDAQKGHSSHPRNPGAPRRAVPLARRSEVREATNKEPHVCGRARVGERPVSLRRGVRFGTLSL